MLVESVFSKGKCLEGTVQLHTEVREFTDVEYANSCFALPTGAIFCANGSQLSLASGGQSSVF